MLESPANRELEQLYVLHQPWLKSWLRSKLADVHAASDVAQDVFVGLLTRPNPEPIEQPRALLACMAKRLLISRWRRDELERAYLEALAAQPLAYAPSPEELAVIAETLLEVDALLAGLKPVVRRAFLLSQLEGLRQQQIADRLGISVATVKRYLTQAAMHCYFSQSAEQMRALR